MCFAPQELFPEREPQRLFFNGDETGSRWFRIPFLLSASDGTLIAGTDANFGSTGDSAENIDAAIRRRSPEGVWEAPFLPPALHLRDYADEPGYRQKSASFIDGMILQDTQGVGTPGRLHLMIDGWAWNGGLFQQMYPTVVRKVAPGDGFARIGDRKYLLLTSRPQHTEDGLNGNTDLSRFDYAADLWGSRDERGQIPVYCLESSGQGVSLGARTEYSLTDAMELCRNGDLLYLPQKGESSAGEMVPMNPLYEDSVLQMYNTSYFYHMVSDDLGRSWRLEQIASGLCKRTGTGAYLTGPGRGVQLECGPYRGRMLFPTYYFQEDRLRSEVIFSDDGGKTWAHSATVPSGGSISESALVELPDGSVGKFMRNAGNSGGKMVWSVSHDGGMNWSRPQSVLGDNEAGVNCQLSALRYSRELPSREGGRYPALLLASPFSSKRTNGRLLIGLIKPDGHCSGGVKYRIDWEYQIQVTAQDTLFAYSCLTELPDGRIGLLYETSPTDSWQDGLQAMIYEEFALSL
ncbi:MAG: exo-alpha-sialidase [Oscillospiraceae bacterium]|jgi:sialidase-1|nr:exo-alpha-sialidase [Oscillospiraceae bacterium]